MKGEGGEGKWEKLREWVEEGEERMGGCDKRKEKMGWKGRKREE